MGGVGAGGSLSPSSVWLQGPITRRAGDHTLPARKPGGDRDASEAGRVLAPAHLADRAAVLCGPLLSIPPRSPPLPLDARVPAAEGAGEPRSVSRSGSEAASDSRVARGAAAHGLLRPEHCDRGHGGAFLLVLFAGSEPGRS